MDKVASLTDAQRQELFEETATARSSQFEYRIPRPTPAKPRMSVSIPQPQVAFFSSLRRTRS